MNEQQSTLNRPWLDPNGKLYSDDALKEISKSWDLGTWEQFLKETVDHAQRELTLDPAQLDQLSNDIAAECWNDFMSKPSSDETKELLRRLVRDHLTARQQQIVRLHYWDGFSERRIADVVGVSRSTVVAQKKRSLKKLRHLFDARMPELSIGKGEPNIPTNSEDSVIQDVFQQEVNRVSVRTPLRGLE